MRRHLPLLALSAIGVFYFFSNLAWLNSGTPLPLFHYYVSDFYRQFAFYDLLGNADAAGIMREFYFSHDASLYGLSAMVFAHLFEKSWTAILIGNNLPYFILALISLYKTGERFADRNAGLLAAGIFSLYPAVYGTSRHFSVAFAVMCMAAFSVYCLIRSETFTGRKYSIAFGVAVGWGMLLKFSLLGFIIGPLLYTLLAALAPRRLIRRRRSKQLANMALAAFAGLLLMAPRYTNMESLRFYSYKPFWLPSSRPWHAFENIEITVLGLIERHLSLPFFLLLVLTAYFFYRKADRRIAAILTLWILPPWLVYIFMPHKRMFHYIIPALPAMALISALGLHYWAGRKKKPYRTAACLVAVVGLFQFFDFSFGMPYTLVKRKILGLHYFRPHRSICARPEKVTAYDRALGKIKDNLNIRKGKVLVLSPFTPQWQILPWFHDHALPFKLIAPHREQIFQIRGWDYLEQAQMILLHGKDWGDPEKQYQTLSRWFDVELNELQRGHLLHFSDQTFSFLNEMSVDEFRARFKQAMARYSIIDVVPDCDGTCYIYSRPHHGDERKPERLDAKRALQ